MILRAEVVFTLAVALAGFQQSPGHIDAQLAKRVLGPAAAVAGDREPPLGGQHAVALVGGDVLLEFLLGTEQTKPVLDLPDHLQLAAGGRRVCRLRCGLQGGRGAGEEDGGGRQGNAAHRYPGTIHDV
jgi:hypothetical protein